MSHFAIELFQLLHAFANHIPSGSCVLQRDLADVRYRRSAISHIMNSGGHFLHRTRDLLDSCEIAKKNGATTIVVTASGSPLANLGKIHLAADHPESYEKFSPMVSRLLHLMIVDVLATAVALRIGSTQLQPMLRNMKQNLLNKRYS